MVTLLSSVKNLIPPTSEVPKFAKFFMSAARTWVCPIALVVMTMPLVLTVATEVLDDVHTYIPLPPDGCKQQRMGNIIRENATLL